MEYITQYLSPLGPLVLTASDAGLTGLWLDAGRCPAGERTRQDDHPVFVQARQWLDAYFRGIAPRAEDLPLILAGTEFQLQVWNLLLTIPWGRTVTYGELARELGQLRGKEKMSAQAVGQAVGANPISIIVPCHRVVGAKGRLTGYGGGLDRKIWLLRHEGWLKEDMQ